MVMKLPELNLTRLPSCLKGSENDAFVDKRKLLTVAEMNDSMKVSSQEVLELIGPNVPCVGCRRRYDSVQEFTYSRPYCVRQTDRFLKI
jgi:hypothetical protein